VRPLLLAALAAVLSAPAARPAPPPPAGGPVKKSAPGGAPVEVRYTDDSTMKVKLLDDKLELTTRHGVLQIPAADVRRIDFATRVPTEVAEQVARAIAKLNNDDFKVREEATEELKELKERAYPQVVKAVKSQDPEVSRRAEEIAAHIKLRVPAALLEVREFDVVHTDDSKNTGRLSAEYLRVGTYQYGELRLKLHDAHSLKSGAGAAAEELAAAVPGPASMSGHANQPGKVFVFSVTGANGGLYGTDVYTTDSSLAAAVVHAGLAKVGETVVVKVRVIANVPAFVGSTRHGLTSSNYSTYTGYEFVRNRP